MTKIATDLNPAARAEFEAFIAANAKAGVATKYTTWWDDMNFTANGLHFELRGQYTESGNPATISFGPEHCVFEDVD